MAKLLRVFSSLLLSCLVVFLISNSSFAASIITGAGLGGSPHIRSFGTAGSVEDDPDKLYAYAEDYRGGVRIATGDIDSDGVDEIITGTGENGGPHLRVFEKDGTQRGIQFFPFDENFRGGMDVASGDFDGDGKEDIAVSQFSNGQAWVKVYRYNTDRTVLFEKNVFGIPECGATVAMGQLDNDHARELIVGAGSGCDPYVHVFDYSTDSKEGSKKPLEIFAFDNENNNPIRSGIDVSAGDVDDNGKDEIVASRLKDDYSWVKLFRYNSEQTELANFKAYGDFKVGANVEMYDIDSDKEAEIITGSGPGGGPQVRAFEYDGTVIDDLNGFFAYNEGFRGGVDVGVYGEAMEEENEDDRSDHGDRRDDDNSRDDNSGDNDDSNDDSDDNSDDINDVPVLRLPINDIDIVTGIQIFGSPSHTGFDFELPDPTPIYAPIAGTISDIMKIQMSNNLWIVDVFIEYNSYYQTFIAFEPYTYEESVIDDQIDSLVVSEGDIVTEGQLLGTLESVPATDFPHIHWQVQNSENEPLRPYSYCSDSAKAQIDTLYDTFGGPALIAK
ncbi:MAG: VCBS repeat-containing protein [Parcubacteria group bacterium]|nr:VCBS repeat-containing protein [Parcubacteria group bacterium]